MGDCGQPRVISYFFVSGGGGAGCATVTLHHLLGIQVIGCSWNSTQLIYDHVKPKDPNKDSMWFDFGVILVSRLQYA